MDRGSTIGSGVLPGVVAHSKALGNVAQHAASYRSVASVEDLAVVFHRDQSAGWRGLAVHAADGNIWRDSRAANDRGCLAQSQLPNADSRVAGRVAADI